MNHSNQSRLEYLFHQYLNNQISAEEYTELWQCIAEKGENQLSQELELLWENVELENPMVPENEWDQKMRELIQHGRVEEGKPLNRKRIPAIRKYEWAVAAALAALLFAGFYIYKKQPVATTGLVTHTIEKKDLPPGGNKAVLTLSNGSVIILDSAANGLIGQQGNSTISKTGNGKISYNPMNLKSAEVVYNTLRTPLGGNYQLELPDGSKVWLDAASTIRFPSAFTGEKRVVEVTGEAYFEVKSDASKPFEVAVDGMKIKVLGTHFNIKAYDNEPLVKTTLIKGKVSVNKGSKSVLLSPGEQAQLDKNGKINVVNDININKIIAWKNDLFWFENDNIQTIMREIARWYNVDVVIKGNIPQHFTGSIPRNVNVSKVFEVLEETGRLHFKIEGDKIIVNG